MPAPQHHIDLVYEYLQAAAIRSRTTDAAPFTRETIAKATGLNESEVKQAISDCNEISSHLVQVKIHLPDTRSGDKIRTRMAKSRMVARSPFLAAFIVLCLLLVAAANYPVARVNLPSQELAQAYLDGAYYALLLATFPGLMLAFLLQRVWTRWVNWQAKEPDKHARIWNLTFMGCSFGAGFVAAYFGWALWNGSFFEWSIATLAFLAGFPIGWSYEQALGNSVD